MILKTGCFANAYLRSFRKLAHLLNNTLYLHDYVYNFLLIIFTMIIEYIIYKYIVLAF